MWCRLLAVVLGLSVWTAQAQDQPITKTSTVDDTSGSLSGKAMPGVVVIGKPCTFGDTFHYQITDSGELRVEGPITCSTGAVTASQVNGNELICHLNIDLRCIGEAGSNEANVDYEVSEDGVKVNNGKIFAWANPQKAAALLPVVKEAIQKSKDNQKN
jgi:hypothetical protein